jgi:type IV pilus assembly protein PilB
VVGDPSSPGGEVVAPSTRRVLLGELLVESNVITKEQLAEVLAAPREPGKKLGQILLERGWMTEAQLTQTLSLQLSVPWVSLYHIDFSRQLLNRVSRELAEMYCLIPIFVRHVKGHGETLYVAMDDPTNELALQEVSRQANLPAKPMISSASDIRNAIRVYYGEITQSASIDIPAPPRGEPAVTVREPRPAPPPPPSPKPAPKKPATLPNSEAAPMTPAAPTIREEQAPLTTRSEPPKAAASVVPNVPGSVIPGDPNELPLPRRMIPKAEDSEPAKKKGPKMVALTLLDGTTITLPAKKKKEGASDALTARDFVSALRATAHGADASEILGDQVRWEPIVAALLSILLRKGLIADWEFVEELRKI